MIVIMENAEIKNPAMVRAFFAALPDGRHLIESDKPKKRTSPQNRYFHGILLPEFRKALNGVGYDEVKTDEQSKLIIKSMFLTRQTVNKETGETIEYVQDTHTLTTVEMMALVDEVIRFAAQNMNYIIPLPNEQLTMLAEWDQQSNAIIIQ